MKFTLSWLKDHLETDAGVTAIAEALTDLGLEVEDVTDPAAALRDFRLGHVTAAEKHPDADRLRVCTVETADGPAQIICGAPSGLEPPPGPTLRGTDAARVDAARVDAAQFGATSTGAAPPRGPKWLPAKGGMNGSEGGT